ELVARRGQAANPGERLVRPDDMPAHTTEGVPPMSSRTVRLHRVLRSPPAKVYRAFVDPDAIARWLPPYGFTCTVHEIDAREGGRFRMSLRNFSTGESHSSGGEHLELAPGRRIR